MNKIENDSVILNQEESRPKKNKKPSLLALLLFLFLGGFAIWLQKEQPTTPIIGGNNNSKGYSNFKSEDDFASYLSEADQVSYGGFFGFGGGFSQPAMMMESTTDMMVRNESVTNSKSTSANRISSTNTQVKNIDEPDIVKTDGTNIFTSLGFSRDYMSLRRVVEPMIVDENSEETSKMIAPLQPKEIRQPQNMTYSAYPPENLSKLSEIGAYGEMLISGDNLVVFEYDRVVGFDISNPQNPDQLWQIDMENDTTIQTSRLLDDSLYVITRTNINSSAPCPIQPLIFSENAVNIPCNKIFHPDQMTSIDTTYTIFEIDPSSGEVGKNISFVGSSSQSVVYMSENNIYITTTSYGDMADYLHKFFTTDGSDLVSKRVSSKLSRLASYDLSSGAKMTEIQSILENYYRGLDNDERARIENEITNRMSDFASKHMREMETTSVAQIDVNKLEMKNFGSVPGRPLNQFSLDEYDDSLRIATTVGGRSLQGSESENDVYVLDRSMKTVGSVLGMGLDEKIYAMRFMGDVGYVVTFRETDPFYVLDLKNPTNPSIEGELKIPGFSSYLHPLSETEILGVGRDSGKVKLSVFDVSDPSKPTEKDKYLLDAYWSDVQNTHHAFLQDEKHGVFFLPASANGYVFGYDEKLTLKKVVSDTQARRALYLDDYLYVIGDERITVLDESKNFETVKTLNL